MSRSRTMTAPVVAGLLLAMTGCTTVESWPDVAPTKATLVPTGREDAGGFSTGVLPLGSVPYDNRSLPIIDAGGQFVATQTGEAPEWSTLLSSPGAPVPTRTRVEVHRIDRQLGETQRVWTSDAALVLGRSADDEGVLVEGPRLDGTRRIGKASWLGAGVAWLVDDAYVNAFGCLGPDGRLAWSRRAVSEAGDETDASHFDLVVRSPEGDEWMLAAQGGDWLLPAWSGRVGAEESPGLFALYLQDGRLEAVFMNAADADTARETIMRLPIADEVSRHDAYQTVASQAHVVGVAAVSEPALFFWHPAAARMGLWLPISSPGAPALLTPGSIAAELDRRGLLLVGTTEHLTLEDPAGSSHRVILPGPHVPRRVDRDRWPYVVMSPGPDRIGLLALRLVNEH